MKTAFAVAMAALMLVTGCSRNRNEAPAQPTAAAPADASTPTAEHPAEAAVPPATTPASSPTPGVTTPPVGITVTTPPPAAPDHALTVTDVAGNVVEKMPSSDERPAATPPPASPAEPKAPDALEWMKQREEQRADYQKKLTDTEARVNTGNAAIAEWQNMILAFKNPFRPRPQLTAEEAQAINGKDGGERVSWAEGKLAEAVAARDAAQRDLDTLKATPPN